MLASHAKEHRGDIHLRKRGILYPGQKERTRLMTIPVPFTETLSETWLLERTYHAQLLNGSELSAFDLTQAMKQMVEFSAPFSAWREIAPEDAAVAYHQGTPILLYGEHSWEHPKNATGAWGANKQMRILIFGTGRSC
jgi:hypothetical protein